MQNKDARFRLIKVLFDGGAIKSFLDIFKYNSVPNSVFATCLGKKPERLTQLKNRIDKFTLGEIYMIAQLCDLSMSQMLDLLKKEYQKGVDPGA
jgi:hypothetical protein